MVVLRGYMRNIEFGKCVISESWPPTTLATEYHVISLFKATEAPPPNLPKKQKGTECLGG